MLVKWLLIQFIRSRLLVNLVLCLASYGVRMKEGVFFIGLFHLPRLAVSQCTVHVEVSVY